MKRIRSVFLLLVSVLLPATAFAQSVDTVSIYSASMKRGIPNLVMLLINQITSKLHQRYSFGPVTPAVA